MKQKESRVQRFPSLRAMRDEHNRLVKWYRSHREDPERLNENEIRKFLKLAVETGALLDANQERQAGQSILDYWTTILFQKSRESVEATLADYDPASGGVLEDAERPYPGLEPFDGDRWVMYFGRERQCEGIWERLSKEPVVVLVGATGVGKTSLLRAGVLPVLHDRGLHSATEIECLPVVVPGCDPLGNLARVIGSDDPDEIGRHIKGFHGSSDYLRRIIEKRSRQPVVLAVDGLEELVTLSPEQDARAFADNIVPLMQAGRGKHVLILTIRSGAIADLEKTFPELQRLVKERQEIVEPLDAIGVQMAITSPAERVGLRFEEGLVDALVRDFLGEAPALLQLTLVNLWTRRIGTRVDWKAYAELGRGRAALQNLAEHASVAWSDSERSAAKSMLLRLFQPGAHAGEIRGQRVQKKDLLESVQGRQVGTVLEAFSERGLIRITESNTHGDLRVEPIHDVLVDSWPELRAWTYDRELKVEQARTEREGARAEREAELKRSARRYAKGLMIVSLMLVLSLWFVWEAFQQSEVRGMILSSVESADSDADESLAFAAAAANKDPSSATAGVLLRAAYNSNTILRLEHTTDGDISTAVSAIVVKPDGSMAISAGEDNSIMLWDLATQVRSRRLVRHFPADNPLTRNTIEGHGGDVTSVAVNKDWTKLLSGSEDKSLILWDIATGTLLKRFSDNPETPEQEGHRNGVRAVAFSPDGRTAISGSTNNDLILWPLEAGGTPTMWVAHGKAVRSVAFTPDGRFILSASNDRSLNLWSLETEQPKLVRRFSDDRNTPEVEGHTDKVMSVAISSDGCLAASGSRDGGIMLWELSVATGVDCGAFSEPEYRRVQQAHMDRVRSVAFSPDGRHLLSGGEDRSVVLWSVDPGPRLRELRRFRGHQGRVTSVAFGPVGRNPEQSFFVSGSDDGSLRVWSMYAGTELQRFWAERGKEGAVGPIIFSPDDASLTAAVSSKRGAVVISWDIAKGKLVESFDSPHRAAQAAVSGEGWLLTLFEGDTDLTQWDIIHGKKLAFLLDGHKRKVRSLAIHVDSRRALSGSNGGLILWDLDTKKKIPYFPAEKEVEKVERHAWMIRSLAFAPEGKIVASGSEDGTLLLWNLDGQPDPVHLSGHKDAIKAIAFHPKKPMLASGSRDSDIVLWDFDGREIRRLRGHTNEVRALAFSPDGATLLSGAEDNTAMLWHVDSGQLLHRFRGHSARLKSVAISHDGRLAASGSDDGSIIVWGLLGLLPSDVLPAIGERRYIPPLTYSEHIEYPMLWPW